LKEIEPKSDAVKGEEGCSCGCMCDKENRNSIRDNAGADSRGSHADCSCMCQNNQGTNTASKAGADLS